MREANKFKVRYVINHSRKELCYKKVNNQRFKGATKFYNQSDLFDFYLQNQ